jgi:PAS domain S-box-containing protein
MVRKNCQALLAMKTSIGNLITLVQRWLRPTRSAYDLAPVGLATFSERKQSLIRCNPLFSELLGYMSSRTCIDDFTLALHLEDSALNHAILSELGEKNSLLGQELEFKNVAGEYQRVKCNMHRDSHHQCVEIAVFPAMDEPQQLNSDIASDPRLQQTLSFSMQMLNSSTWEYDLVNERVIHSENWAKTLGYDDEHSLSDSTYWFNLVKEEDQQVVKDAVVAHVRGETELYEAEFRIRDAEDNEHWIRAWGKVIDRDAEGKAVRILGINTDMTELKLSQQENYQLQNQLFQARKMHTMGQLTGGFAHDFNNLLAAVIGYTGLVLDKSRNTLDPQIKSYLSEVYKAGQQGQKLVSQMLNFGRSGSTEMVPAMISLLVKDAVQLLRPSLPSSIALEVQVDELVPSVATNAFKLNQILMNLCINAKDAMDGIGTLNIHLGSTYLKSAVCTCCGESMAGQFVQIQISDTGIGISDEMLPHIFDSYFTTKEIGRGTGVGLSMVDNLMHEHGGHLQVVSKPRQGTTFILMFPPSRQISTEAATIHLGKSRYHAVHSGHILVVDDDRSVGTYVAEVLKHHGHKVTLEFNSVEALARYQDSPYVFDVVVTDQTMPEMTGGNLMRAMKELREDIPVIICTAYSENLDEDTARKAGAKGYLGKPIDVDKLIELVDQSLAQDSSTAA